jgi:hypothetical protein
MNTVDQNHPRRVAIEFACLLAAGILCGRLCLMLDGSNRTASTLPARNFVMTMYHWSGFHRTSGH